MLCLAVPAEQLNQRTAYIDASPLYGTTAEETAGLRTMVDGEYVYVPGLVREHMASWLFDSRADENVQWILLSAGSSYD